MTEKFNYPSLARITKLSLALYQKLISGNAPNPTKFGACIKNCTIQELCRRTKLHVQVQG